MSVFNVIKASTLAFCSLAISAQLSHARDLTSQEKTICTSLRACVDIIRRHDASEFDYAVLETEFRKFGPSSKSALFSVLESADGQADIAQMISRFGSMSEPDRERIKANWSLEKARAYLPLLLDGHPMSRDYLLLTLGHAGADVREQARLGLIRLPISSQSAPLPKTLQQPLLSALMKDPVPQAAPYLTRMNAAGYEKDFAVLLRSGEGDIVGATYAALYRNNPSQAFNALMAEMSRMDSSAQSRAAGEMLAMRHAGRSDGFYLKFARDMSGDSKLSIPARAAGLHAVLEIADGPFPNLTPERAEAFSYLIAGQPLIAQDQYLPYLKSIKAEAALSLIWEMAEKEKWINRDKISDAFESHNSYDAVIRDLLMSGDARSFLAGLRRAKPVHQPLIRAQIDHPVSAISKAARQALKLPASQTQPRTCPVSAFDLKDMRAQMPFFEGGWMVTNSEARINLSRSQLTTSHPSSSGWLAGYKVRTPKSRLVEDGGTVLHYDNISGEFESIGPFQNPLAILPGKPLKLGQTTDQFWVIEGWDGNANDVSAYTVSLGDGQRQISHIGALPKTAGGFSVAPDGDLVMAFRDVGQAPLRLSQTGNMTFACSPSRSATAQPAPR